MICILIRANKIAFIKSLPPTINSLNASSQPQLTDLVLNLRITDHSIYNKDLFMREIYKKELSYFKTRLREWILSEDI